MTSFDVSLVVENLELTDGNVDQLFEVLPDAVPMSTDRLVVVTAPIEAADPESAAFELVNIVTRAFPDAVAVRLDQDLVSVPDIADRVERSRESVRLLVDGKRGPGGFPAPVGTVGGGTRVWPWASVVSWFSDELGEDLGEHCVPPEAAAVVDACLAARRRYLTHRFRVAWSPSETTPYTVKSFNVRPEVRSLAT